MTGKQNRPPVLTGGCQCGAIRYALYTLPEGTHLCHCRMCQKAVGGPFAPLAPVRRKDFAWTRGNPAEFNSSSVAVRNFCADCGTPLAFAYADSDWIAITIGSLDEPARAPPRKHYGVENRLPWFETIVALPGEKTETAWTRTFSASWSTFSIRTTTHRTTGSRPGLPASSMLLEGVPPGNWRWRKWR